MNKPKNTQPTNSRQIEKIAALLLRIRILLVPPDSTRAKTLRKFSNFMLAPFRMISRRLFHKDKEDFDASFYLNHYPDVLMAGVDPYQHYHQYGKYEGRLGSRPPLRVEDGSTKFDPLKETVLIVSHEASRTGAPILSLNLAQNLQKKYNIISFLLGEGSIREYFLDTSIFVVGPLASRADQILADDAIEQLIILSQSKIKFAIVNSIESRAVIPALAKRFIPTITLIHEFATYTRPRGAFLEAILWSHTTIFSASVTHDNAIDEHAELSGHSFQIIPQGLCIPPSKEKTITFDEKEEAKIINTMRPSSLPDSTAIILGVGSVHIRKGVDLFIECADRVIRAGYGEHCRFIWIGSGYDPERDMDYSIYLLEQIRRSGLEQHVFFMGETSNIEAAYKTADVLLITSRLDPLPNVAIDAMMRKLPLICFDKTTGIADILIANGLGEACVVPYIDTVKMAEKVIAFAQSKSLSETVGEQLQKVALKEFDMKNYVAQLEKIGLDSTALLEQEQKDTITIGKSGLAQMDFFSPPFPHILPDQVAHYYIRLWASEVRKRKLFPGFHPGIFMEQSELYQTGCDPLANYLRVGQPVGPWQFEVIRSEEKKETLPLRLRVALHLHVYYPDLLPNMLDRLNKNRVRPDLFISVPTEQIRDEVENLLAENYTGNIIEIHIVPNRGRDIGPFLTAFGTTLMDNYDIVGHLHTKKTADIKSGNMAQEWHAFLIENLLGGKNNMADIILNHFEADPTIGIIFPDDPNVVGWGNNLSYAKAFGQQLGIHSLPQNIIFPVGTMFWAKVEALIPIFKLGLDWQDYPAEPLPYDGSMLHALERMLPLIVSKQGFRPVLTNVTGVTR